MWCQEASCYCDGDGALTSDSGNEQDPVQLLLWWWWCTYLWQWEWAGSCTVVGFKRLGWYNPVAPPNVCEVYDQTAAATRFLTGSCLGNSVNDIVLIIPAVSWERQLSLHVLLSVILILTFFLVLIPIFSSPPPPPLVILWIRDELWVLLRIWDEFGGGRRRRLPLCPQQLGRGATL